MFAKRTATIMALVLALLMACSAFALTKVIKKVEFKFKTPADYYMADNTTDRDFVVKCEKKFTIQEYNSLFYGTFPDDCVEDCDNLVLVAYIEDTLGNVSFSEPMVMHHDTSLGRCVTVDSISSDWVAKMQKKGNKVGGAAVFMELAYPKDSVTQIFAQAFRPNALGIITATIEVEETAVHDGKIGCAATCKPHGWEPDALTMIFLSNWQSIMGGICDDIKANKADIAALQADVNKLKAGIESRLTGACAAFFELATDSTGGVIVINHKFSKIEGGVRINVEGNGNTKVGVSNTDNSEIKGGVEINVDND